MEGGYDLALRLNCPHCTEKDTNAHYMHFCRESTVVATRRKHRSLPPAAIHKCELKKSTANALTAMYDLDDMGRHIDPGAKEDGVCEGLVDHLIGTNPESNRPGEPDSPFCRWGRPNELKDGSQGSLATGCSSWGSRSKNPHLPSPRHQARHRNGNVVSTLQDATPWADNRHRGTTGGNRRIRRRAKTNEEEEHARLKGAVQGAPLIEKKGLAETMVHRLPHPGEHLPGQMAHEDAPA